MRERDDITMPYGLFRSHVLSSDPCQHRYVTMARVVEGLTPTLRMKKTRWDRGMVPKQHTGRQRNLRFIIRMDDIIFLFSKSPD
jgi:hypothetical protein